MANKASMDAKLENDRIPNLRKVVTLARGRALTAGRKVLVDAFRSEAPVGELDRPSPFPKLIDTIREVGRSGDTVAVGSDSILAQWTEFGTQPHTERPKRKQAISYPEADHPSAHVTVSATENPWMRRATAYAQDAVSAAVAAVFKDAIESE